MRARIAARARGLDGVRRDRGDLAGVGARRAPAGGRAAPSRGPRCPPAKGSSRTGPCSPGARTRKWPGKPTPSTRSPSARARLDEHDCQRDRDAGAADEHVVQEAVARVVVVLLVAAEATLAEEVAGHGADRLVGGRPGRQARGGGRGERVELGEVRLRLELGIPDARDRQRRATEIRRVTRARTAANSSRSRRHAVLRRARRAPPRCRPDRGSRAACRRSRDTGCRARRACAAPPPRSSTSNATWGSVGSMSSKTLVCWIRCSWLSPSAYQAPGKPRSGRGAASRPRRSS